MMKSIPLLFVCLTQFSVFGQKTPVELKGIEKELNQILKDQECAGFSVAVVKGNEVIYSQGFGYRNVAQNLPVTANTQFAIGSTSKAFTSALLGILQDEGQLKLDDKTIKYLPNLAFDHPTLASEITIRDMMCHRTGLPRYDFSWYLFNHPSKDSLLARTKYMKPTAELRTEWQYNNFMFLAQGLIVERLTNKTWEQNIQERFFGPLGMKNSTSDINGLKNATEAALPYGNDPSGKIIQLNYFDIMGMSPAGSINSSANELTNWLKVWVNGGALNGKTIIPSEYVKEAMSSQMVINAGIPTKYEDLSFANYGFGWMTHAYRGHYQVEHGGNIDGFSANVSFFPLDSIGIIVLTNQDGSAVPKIVRNTIADRLLGLEKRDWNGDVKKELDKARIDAALTPNQNTKITRTKPSHALQDYAGEFMNPGYGSIIVTQKDDSLHVQIGKYASTMQHQHYDIFNFGNLTDVNNPLKALTFSYQTGIDGKIQSISTQFDGTGTVIFDRYNKPIAVSESELQKYVGNYDLSGTTVKVSVKNNVLYVFVPGQTDYETVAVGNNTFNLTIAKGYSVVFEEKDNKVISMSFVQPNGTFKATRK